MENKNVSIEELEMLSELTKLGPLAEFKVLKARKSAEKFAEIYTKLNPSDEIGVDYSTANDLEYQLRLESLKRGLERSWASYVAYEKDKAYSLDEYTEDFIKGYKEKLRGRQM